MKETKANKWSSKQSKSTEKKQIMYTIEENL